MILEFLPYRACEDILPTLISVRGPYMPSRKGSDVWSKGFTYTIPHGQVAEVRALKLMDFCAGSGKCQGKPEDVKA